MQRTGCARHLILGLAACGLLTVIIQGGCAESDDIDIAIMTPNVARTVGLLCARSGHDDVIDVHVALCARERRHAVITSDPDDISRVDPRLPIIRA